MEKGKHCRIFEESARLGGKFTLRDTGISVDTLLIETKEFGKHYVLTKYKDHNITNRDIDLCRTIAAHHIPESREFKRNGPQADARILLDENMPYRIIPKVLNDAGKISHISFHSLTTLSDPVIWKFAKQNHFHAIITNDDDFVKMVEMETLKRLQRVSRFEDAAPLSDLPFVVYIAPEITTAKLTEKACRDHLLTIAKEATAQNRKIAYATIDKDGLQPGPDAEDIYYKYVRPSIAGIKLFEPVFDKAIMDHNGINCLMQKCGWPLMKFDRSQEWKEFYDQAYSQKQKNVSPFPSKRLL